jgi:hypothetical protein
MYTYVLNRCTLGTIVDLHRHSYYINKYLERYKYVYRHIYTNVYTYSHVYMNTCTHEYVHSKHTLWTIVDLHRRPYCISFHLYMHIQI